MRRGVVVDMQVLSRTTRSGAVLAVALYGTGLACASSTTLSLAPVLYPPPPDTARIQFLTAISTSEDVGGGRSIWGRLLGTGRQGAKAIAKPYGIAMLQGKIYVCDTFINGLDIIDLKGGSFDFFQPTDDGQLLKPINCFVDDDGLLYVTDTERRQIVVFDEDGRYVEAFGGDGGAKPTDVFVSEDRVWVTDMATGQVRVYDKSSRELLLAFPDAEPGTSEDLVAPANLYVTGNAVYVSDALLGKVNVYSRDGTYLRTVGSYGTGYGQFARPKGIAVDRDENLYVVDAAFQNVQMFDREGNLLMFFGGPGTEPGHMTLPAKVIIDYDNLRYFRKYVHEDFRLRYLILVTNQYGSDKIGVYGFVGPPAAYVSDVVRAR